MKILASEAEDSGVQPNSPLHPTLATLARVSGQSRWAATLRGGELDE